MAELLSQLAFSTFKKYSFLWRHKISYQKHPELSSFFVFEGALRRAIGLLFCLIFIFSRMPRCITNLSDFLVDKGRGGGIVIIVQYYHFELKGAGKWVLNELRSIE